MNRITFLLAFFAVTLSILLESCGQQSSENKLSLNDQEYLSKSGLSVLAFHNFYTTGHQGGIEIIQHDERIATNGFIRMQPVEGRRLPNPDRATREIDRKRNEIRSTVRYDDFDFGYKVTIRPEANGFCLTVDLDKPIPSNWENRLTFEMEIYPPLYYGKTFQIGESFGIVPRMAVRSVYRDEEGSLKGEIMGTGKSLTLAGEDPLRKLMIESLKNEIILADGRETSKGGWIMVKSIIPAGVSEGAVEWFVSPNVIEGWTRDPVIALSQVGYHPDQVKQAIIELGPSGSRLGKASLMKVTEKDGLNEVLAAVPSQWGRFLRYDYAIFDFTEIKEPGMYVVCYEDQRSNPFSIDSDVFRTGVWQPALEGYFPVQMCHIKVKEGSAIWHNACHLDDALQAPLDIEHVDGYRQYKDAETKYPPMTTVPFLNRGGWHDAGDDDLAAGSQAATTHYLVLANEICSNQTDQTLVNFEDLYVEMNTPDGIPDFVQQIKHGAINLLSGYRAAGHSFAGIIANREGRNITGDWASQTDQLFYDRRMKPNQKTLTHSGVNDERWVFTNKDTGLEYLVSAALAASSRSLRGFDDKLADECLETAGKAWDFEQNHEPVIQRNAYVPRNTKVQEIIATAELLYTTGEEKYATHMMNLLPAIKENIGNTAWCVARVSDRLSDNRFNEDFMEALKSYKITLDSTLAANPYGVPWRPAIWGIGWDIQEYALEHYFLVMKYPDLFDRELVLRVVNYVLGCHPGSSTSLVSGVGAHSITNAFGVYRFLESYIPGGMVSGTALIRPDYPELKETTPYLWQQSEYVMPGAASYIFCVLAADKLLGGI